MSREIYEVKRERFHLTDRNLYLLEGTWPKGYEAEAVLDGKKYRLRQGRRNMSVQWTGFRTCS